MYPHDEPHGVAASSTPRTHWRGRSTTGPPATGCETRNLGDRVQNLRSIIRGTQPPDRAAGSGETLRMEAFLPAILEVVP